VHRHGRFLRGGALAVVMASASVALACGTQAETSTQMSSHAVTAAVGPAPSSEAVSDLKAFSVFSLPPSPEDALPEHLQLDIEALAAQGGLPNALVGAQARWIGTTAGSLYAWPDGDTGACVGVPDLVTRCLPRLDARVPIVVASASADGQLVVGALVPDWAKQAIIEQGTASICAAQVGRNGFLCRITQPLEGPPLTIRLAKADGSSIVTAV